MFCPGGSCVLLFEDGVLLAWGAGTGRVSGAVTLRRLNPWPSEGSACKLRPHSEFLNFFSIINFGHL